MRNGVSTAIVEQELTRVRARRGEVEFFKELVSRKHPSWPGPVFSVNSSGRIWPWAGNGHTHEAERHYVEGLSPVVDLVAERFLQIRWMGGRLFIDASGAFYKDDHTFVQFVEFNIQS